MAAIHLTDETFNKEVLQSDIPVLVDFWGEWCAPCTMMAPVVDKLSVEMNGKVKIAKLDVHQYGSLAQQYRVASIPTFIVFSNGTIKSKGIGAMPYADLKDLLS